MSDTTPSIFQTIPSVSITVGDRVWTVFVAGNDTAEWDDTERRQKWQKARAGQLYPGVLSVIDHDKQIVNVDFDDGDKTVGVPFNLVKRQDGQCCDETLCLDKRRPSNNRDKTTRSNTGHR